MLKKNTGSQALTFALVNSGTGAALTGASVTARRSIDGGAQATAGGAVTELGNGQYLFSPSQADTNGDLIGYLFTATSAIPVNLHVRTTAADLADGVRLGLTALPAAAAGASGGLPTGDASGRVLLQPTQTGVTIPTVTAVTNAVALPSIPNNWITAAGIALGAIDADAISTDAVTEIQSGLASASSLTSVGALVAAVKLVTDALGTAVEADGGVYRFTTNALEQAPTGSGGGHTPEEIAEAVRTELQVELSMIDVSISSRFNGDLNATNLVIACGVVTSSPADNFFYAELDKVSEGGLYGAIITITSASSGTVRNGQPRVIVSAQVQGSTASLTVSPPYDFRPEAGDEIAIWALGPTNLNTINGEGFVGGSIPADLVSVLGTPADEGGVVPANVMKIVDVQLTGDGTANNPWGPA